MTKTTTRVWVFLLFLSLSACGSQATRVGNPAGGTPIDTNDAQDFHEGGSIPGTALLNGVTVPGESLSGQNLASPVLRQESALLYQPMSADVDEVVCFPEPILKREKVAPYSEALAASDFVGTIFYVDDDAHGDGTMSSPFRTIGEAIAAASALETTAAILVAGGTYAEDLSVGPGQYLYGGFDADSWTRNMEASPSIIRDQTTALLVAPSHPSNETIIDGFTIYGAVHDSDSAALELAEGARLIMRHNTVYLNMAVVDWETYGDTHYGRGVIASGASLQAYNNRFLVPSSSPEHVISTGFLLINSCEILFNNHFVAYRSSVSSYGGQGELVGNLIEDGYNGIMTHEESLKISSNTIALQAYDHGCGYSIYMESSNSSIATNPSINNNSIIIQGGSGNGINEASSNADPVSLVGNHFILLGEAAPEIHSELLYGDVDQSHSADRVNKPLYTIDEVNAMTDIATVSGNTISSYSETELGL